MGVKGCAGFKALSLHARARTRAREHMKGVKGVKVYRNGARTGGAQRFRTSTPYTHQPYRQVRDVTAAVLVVIVRVVGYTILGLAALAFVLWAALSHTGLATMAWLGVVFVTIAGAGAAVEWLEDRHRKAAPCGCLCGCPGPGRDDGDGVVCDPCRMNIHQEA